MPPAAEKKWSRRPPPPPSRGAKLRAIALTLLVVGAVTLGILALRESSPPAATVKPVPTPPATLATFDSEQGLRFVTLFFADLSGRGLISEIRQRPPCLDQAGCLDDTLQALRQGPSGGGATLLPKAAQFRVAEINGETVSIYFDRNTINQIPGGVMSELLCLTSLANTVAVNFPHLRQIAIVIDGTPATTFKGHVDLSTPFRANFELVKPVENPTLTSPPTTPTGSQSR